VVVALALSGAVLGSGVTAETASNATANLPNDAESAEAARLQDRLSSAQSAPAIVVYDRRGDRLTAADRRAVAAEVRELTPLASDSQRVFPVLAEDGRAAFVGVPLSTSIPESDLAGPVGNIRAAASTDLPDGLRARVTGGPAFTVDLSKVFDGADTRLLATTAGVVALLLLLTYRSPWLWLVPLTVVGLADQVAAKALAAGTHVFGFAADGATTGITSVLVFGAGTNYALLLIARYREELRREADRYDAMRVALGRAAPAILASSGAAGARPALPGRRVAAHGRRGTGRHGRTRADRCRRRRRRAVGPPGRRRRRARRARRRAHRRPRLGAGLRAGAGGPRRRLGGRRGHAGGRGRRAGPRRQGRRDP
jgi:RND superfamily putative drug exporter